MSGKICKSCEETNAAGALICFNCGNALHGENGENTQAARKEDLNTLEMPRYSYGSDSSGNGCAIALLFVAALVIPLFGLIVGAIFAFSDDSDKQVLGTFLMGFGLIIIIISMILGAALM